MAADKYGLSKLAENIEDLPDNSTRFLIIGTQEAGPSGQDKSTVVIAMRNEPGALHDLLEPFQRHQIDLTRVETRPSRSGNWNYVVCIDLNGHGASEKGQAALKEGGSQAADVKILGSYPHGVL